MTEETHTPSVFVTGAETPVGRVVVRTLAKRGYKVVGATRDGSHGARLIREDGGIPSYPDLTREGEIRSVLNMSKAEFVVHVASQEVNLLPTLNYDYDAHLDVLDTSALVNACKGSTVKRIVYTSFAFLYGDTEGHSVDETHALSRDNDFYKAAIRAENALLKGDFPAVVLRAGYLYGEHNGAVDALHNALIKGLPVFDGEGLASFVHVNDLASAVLAVLDTPELPHNVYNITDDAPLRLSAFTDTLGEALGVGGALRLPLVSGALLGDTQLARLSQSFAASNARAKAELGWKPTYASVSAGIDRMLMNWRAEGAASAPATSASKDIVPA